MEYFEEINANQYKQLLIDDKEKENCGFDSRDIEFAWSRRGGKVINDRKFVINRDNCRIIVNKLYDQWFAVRFINYTNNTSSHFKCDHTIELKDCLRYLLTN